MSAKRTSAKQRKQEQEIVLGFCHECANAHALHERDYKGEPFLCKCHADEGTWYEPYSRFLDKRCENGHFKPKTHTP